MRFHTKNTKTKAAAETPQAQRDRAESKRRRTAENAAHRADRKVTTDLALRAVVGHVTVTRTEVIAWYVLDPYSVSFRSPADIERTIIGAGATSFARIGGRTYWRITSRPFSVREWAERTYADARAHGTPLPGYPAFLEREQRRMIQCAFAEKVAYIGVRVTDRRRHPLDARREVAVLGGRLDEIADQMAGPGLDAEPATPEQMELLLRRSIALGMPSPRLDTVAAGDWESADLPQLEQLAQVTGEPFSRTAQVRHITDRGEAITRHVAVLTMGRVGELDIPQDGKGGWMHRADRLGIPYEFMGTVDQIDPADAHASLRHRMDVIQDQWEHYTVEHKVAPPEILTQQHAMALEAERELDSLTSGEATRTHGWFRLAVWGDTQAEAMRRVETVRKEYGHQIEWWHSGGQRALVREFIPGEPLANAAHRRRFVLPSLMAAMPAATAAIGDGYGAAFGATSGISRTAVSFDFWRDMEVRDRSGLLMLLGALGSGKSVAAALIVYRTVMSGVLWSVLDPSGRLGSLCELPELRDYARYYDLTRGKGGELSPYRVVAEPRREHYKPGPNGEAEWLQDVRSARATRQSLARDVLTAFLPKTLRSNDQVTSVMGRATRAVPAEVDTSAAAILDYLKLIIDEKAEKDLTPDYRIKARDVLAELEGLAGTNRGQLVFGESAARSDHLLEVYGLAGIRVPDAETLAAGEEDTETRVALALFSLAAWKVQTRTFAADPNQRKGLVIDEGHLLAAIPTGPALITKCAVDSRKHDLRAIIASQNASHFDQQGLANLVGLTMVGKTTDDSEGGEGMGALSVLGMSGAKQYLPTLAALSPELKQKKGQKTKQAKYKDFIISAKDDRGASQTIEKCVADGYAHPHVLEAIQTTPGSRKEATA